MKPPKRTIWHTFNRRLSGLTAVALLCALMIPLPISRSSNESPADDAVEKDTSQPFPCQNRPCGCRSASQCWKQCCCFTNAQKVAWAKARRVDIPEFVVAAAERERAAECQQTTESSAAACCRSAKKADGNGRADEDGTTASKSEKALAGRSRSARWVLAVYAAECSGQAFHGFCLPLMILPDSLLCRQLPDPVVELLPLESDRLPGTVLSPPTPPPKIG